MVEVLAGVRIGEDAELRDELDARGERAERETSAGIFRRHLALEGGQRDPVIDLPDELVERSVRVVRRERDRGGGVVVPQGERSPTRADLAVGGCGGAGRQQAVDGDRTLSEMPFSLGRVAGRDAGDAQGRSQRGERDAIQFLTVLAESAGRLHHTAETGLSQRVVDVQHEIVHGLVRIVGDVGGAVGSTGSHKDVHRLVRANDQGEVRIRQKLSAGGHVHGGDDPGDAVGVGDSGFQLIGELQLRDGRVVDPADVRVNRPRIKAIGALPADHIVVALTAEEPVVIRGLTLARAAVAEQPVVTAKAIKRVAALAAVHAIPSR